MIHKLVHLLIKPFSTIRTNSNLLFLFSKRTLAVKYQGSLLGQLWNIAYPLINLAVYTFVFGVIYQGKFGVRESETSIQYALGIFVGLNFLYFFSDSLTGAVYSILGNPNYVKKIVFPLDILPVSIIAANTVTFLISTSLTIIAIVLLTGSLTIHALWLPVIFIPILFLSQGLAWLVASLGVFFRDLAPVVQVITSVMLWLSAVFYSVISLPEQAWQILRFNPLLLAIENARQVLLWGTEPNLFWLAYSSVVAIITFYLGYFTFSSLKSAFADVI